MRAPIGLVTNQNDRIVDGIYDAFYGSNGKKSWGDTPAFFFAL